MDEAQHFCLAVVSREGAVHNAFRGFFDSCGVPIFHFASVSELFRTLPERRINGIVADVPVLVRASLNEKMLYEGIEGIFPNVRVNWNRQADFKVLFGDPGRSGEENLKAFLKRCLAFTPRSLRRNDRKQRNLNLLVREEGQSLDNARRAFTTDLSHGGLFAGTCEPPAVGTTVWLQVLELGPEPFKTQVRWNRSWGEGMAIPGFGVKFLDPTPEQKGLLHEMLA
jgi:hypothetical protein